MNAVRDLTHQGVLDLAIQRGQSFDHYVSGPNGLAVAALRELPAQHAARYFIYGASGTGKTHLLNAMCKQQQDMGQTAMLVTPSLLAEQAAALVECIDTLSLIAFDDIHEIAGLAAQEEALFHIYNRAKRSNVHFIAAAREKPANVGFALPDLQSRLNWGNLFQLRSLDDAGRKELLRNRAADRGIILSDQVIDYVLRRADRDTSSLMELIRQLDELSLSQKRRITVPLVRAVLAAPTESAHSRSE